MIVTDEGTAATSPHYNQLQRQPIVAMLEDFTADEFRGYLMGNVVKYTMRKGLKAGTNDENKAKQYQHWLDEFIAFNCITLNGKVYSKDK